MTGRQILMIIVPCKGFHYVKGRAPHFDESLAPIGSAYAVIDTSHHSERLTPFPTITLLGRPVGSLPYGWLGVPLGI